jgi:hypothetical protein
VLGQPHARHAGPAGRPVGVVRGNGNAERVCAMAFRVTAILAALIAGSSFTALADDCMGHGDDCAIMRNQPVYMLMFRSFPYRHDIGTADLPLIPGFCLPTVVGNTLECQRLCCRWDSNK